MKLFKVMYPQAFDERPEFAMGIHFGMSSNSGRQLEKEDAFVIFNGTFAVRVEDIYRATQPIPTAFYDEMESFVDEDIEVELGQGGFADDVSYEEPDQKARWTIAEQRLDLVPCENVEFISDILLLPEWTRQRLRRHGRLHGSPPFRGESRAGQQFVRFSRFYADRRITSRGGLLPGTFATSKLDAQIVLTALTAVGHYALPSIAPPIYRFEIVPPPLTYLYYGTVSPAFGQSGGGTEIEFYRGVSDGAVSGPLMLPYL